MRVQAYQDQGGVCDVLFPLLLLIVKWFILKHISHFPKKTQQENDNTDIQSVLIAHILTE